MDKSLRRNEICIIGQPRCDFAFSSTRTCFIAYGFEVSTLEMTILKGILESKGIQPVEAGGNIAPGQNAFCAKICSKIITSQFCIILLNNDNKDGQEIPNANVNMEYGLMLGFNKYVIPFQRSEQNLPFNVAGLDTIKYSNNDFEGTSSKAIDQAIKETTQDDVTTDTSEQSVEMFLLGRNMMYSPIDSEGEKNLYRLGQPLGFNLLVDFIGDNYTFFGRFATLRSEAVIWRLRKMNEILNGRRSSIPLRLEAGVISTSEAELGEKVFSDILLLVVVTSDIEKNQIKKELSKKPLDYKAEVLSIDEVLLEFQNAGS